MTLFHTRPRNATTRLLSYNCVGSGYYFITLCTKDYTPWFGKIVDQKMELSRIGLLVHQCWQSIPAHFSFVGLDEFIILPDRVLGIVRINDQDRSGLLPNNTRVVEAQSLAVIVRRFKIGITKYAKTYDSNFAWQPSYYEVVVRDAFALHRIRRYIKNNPMNWKF